MHRPGSPGAVGGGYAPDPVFRRTQTIDKSAEIVLVRSSGESTLRPRKHQGDGREHQGDKRHSREHQRHAHQGARCWANT